MFLDLLITGYYEPSEHVGPNELASRRTHVDSPVGLPQGVPTYRP